MVSWRWKASSFVRDALETCSVVETSHRRRHRLDLGDLGGVQTDRDNLEKEKRMKRVDRPEGEVMEHFPLGAIEMMSTEMAKIRPHGAGATSSSAQSGQDQTQTTWERAGQ